MKDICGFLRENVDLATFVGRDLDLKEEGRYLVAKCPFHNHDTKPSFKIDKERNRFRCYSSSCGKEGSAIDYVMARDKTGIRPAIRVLQREFPDTQFFRKPREGHIKTDIRAREIVTDICREYMNENPGSKQYLYDRGVTDDDISFWDIVIAPPDLIKKAEKTIARETLEKIGVVGKDGPKRKYNFIEAGWIMFPVLNVDGNLSHWWLKDPSGKSERQIPGDCRDGWIMANVFDVMNSDRPIIVEGIWDMIQVKRAGYPCAATLGHISKKQIQFLVGTAEVDPIFPERNRRKTYGLWFDRDKNLAGQIQSNDVADELCKLHDVLIYKCPEVGLDPDDFLRGGGKISDLKPQRYVELSSKIKATPQGYFVLKRGKEGIEWLDQISDFTMDIKYQLLAEGQFITRIVVINYKDRQCGPFEFTRDDMFSKNVFNKWLAGHGNFIFKGTQEDFETMIRFLKETDQSDPVRISRDVGDIGTGIWIYDNAAIVNGEIKWANEDGIILTDIPDVPAIRTARGTREDLLEDPKKKSLVLPKNGYSMSELVTLIGEFYPKNDLLKVLGYATACAFRSIIVSYYHCFSLMGCVGGTDIGKTKLSRIMQTMLGGRNAPMDTKDTNPKAFLRHLEKFSGIPTLFTEYDNSFRQRFINLFDLKTYSRAEASQDSETYDPDVNSPLIFTTETTPAGESFLNRCMIINFNKMKFTKKSSDFNEFYNAMVEDNRAAGFIMSILKSDVGGRILHHIKGLEKDLEMLEGFKADSRLVMNYAIVYGSFSALYSSTKFNSDFKTFFRDAGGYLSEQRMLELIKEQMTETQIVLRGSSRIQIFFNIMKLLWDQGTLSDCVRLMPKKNPSFLRFTFTTGLHDRVLQYDARNGEKIQDFRVNNVTDVINKEFDVKAVGMKLYRQKNDCCYNIPIQSIEDKFGISFWPTRPNGSKHAD